MIEATRSLGAATLRRCARPGLTLLAVAAALAVPAAAAAGPSVAPTTIDTSNPGEIHITGDVGGTDTAWYAFYFSDGTHNYPPPGTGGCFGGGEYYAPVDGSGHYDQTFSVPSDIPTGTYQYGWDEYTAACAGSDATPPYGGFGPDDTMIIDWGASAPTSTVTLDDATLQRIDYISVALWFIAGLIASLAVSWFIFPTLLGGRRLAGGH